MNKHHFNMAQMSYNLLQGCDPITDEPMQTGVIISLINGKMFDEYNKEVTLNDKGTYIYVR